MDLIDLLDKIFGDAEVTIFDQETEQEVVLTDIEDVGDKIADFKTPCLDLVSGGEAYGVAEFGDFEEATFWFVKEASVVSVFLLEDPIDPEIITDENILTEVPLTWDVVRKSGQYIEYEDYLALLEEDDIEGEEATNDVQIEDADTSPVVAETDSDDGEEGSAPVEEVVEEPQAEPVEDAPEQDAIFINDAEVLGQEHPDMVELLSRPVVFMTGELWDQGDRRNTPAGKWKRNELPWSALLTADWSPLTNHPESGNKQGHSIVLGETIDGNRNAESVKSLHALVIDIDSGPTVDSVIEKLESMGLFALVYTSFNHNKTKVVLKHDEVIRKLKLDDTPNRGEIIEYLKMHHKDRYDPEFLEGIEVVDARHHGPKGLQIILETPPLHKFRVVLPLWEPVELADLGTTASQWKDAWADIVTGFVVNELDVSFDSTSCDVNRLFYTPRHPKDAEWDCVLIQGEPLRHETIKPFSKNEYVKNRDNDPFAYGLASNDRPEQVLAPSGMVLNAWHTKAKERFLITDLILAEAPDKVRREVSDGKLEIECPFEHEHSTEGGTGTVVMSPEINENGVWTISCPHDACQGRTKLDFLGEMLKAGWFDEECLFDEEYLLGSDEDFAPAQPEAPKDAEGKTRTVVDMANDLPNPVPSEQIESFLLRAVKLGVNPVDKNQITEIILSKNDFLGKRDLNNYWKDAYRKNDEEKKELAVGDLSEFTGIPVTNQWDKHKLAEYGIKRIQDVNQATPFLFHYIEQKARIEQNALGEPKINILTLPMFEAEINNVTRWEKVMYVGDSEKRIGEFCPKDVSSHLFNTREMVLPPLRGLTTIPTFARNGELIREEGYHTGSGLYYNPDMIYDLSAVSENPTEEEVRAAGEMLMDLVADFPLNGMVRSEIEEKAYSEEGVSALANCLSLILMLFCRELIDGPTPGYLLTKPAPGTGASLLTDACSMIAFGRQAEATAIPKSEEEMSKTLITFMTDGNPMIFFDNINHSVDSGVLASAMTTNTFKARSLGTNDSIKAEVRCAFVFTGNNVSLSPELIRRLVMIDLDANMVAPEDRENFKYDPLLSHIRKNRIEVVNACLTLIQNWISKGKPSFSGKVLNSYEEWSRVMGGILEAAGFNGFLANRDSLKELASSGVEEEIIPMLETWWDEFEEEYVVLGKGGDKPSITDLLYENDIQISVKKSKTVDNELKYSPSALGLFLRNYQNRPIKLSEDVIIRIEKTSQRRKGGYWWRLIDVSDDVAQAKK